MIEQPDLQPGQTLLLTLRHGLTELNRDKRVGGHTDVPLIEEGRRQAQEARANFQGTPFEVVVSSPLERAIQTAVIVTGVAALYLSLLHMLFRRRRLNQRWRTYADMLVEENVWRAQRYGVDGSLMDFGIGELVPYSELVEELIELVHKDADELGCVAEVENAREIIARGTSADRQLQVYREALQAGAEKHEALLAVVDLLIDDSVVGL